MNEECEYFFNAIDTIIKNKDRAVDHEERYAYSTKDDIAINAVNTQGSKWTIGFSVDYKKNNSTIYLTGDELSNLKDIILKARKKLEEVK